jgi:hypothetical protein
VLRKLFIFIGINLAIAALAAFAPASLINGLDYQRHAVVYDFVEAIEPGTHLNVIIGDSRPECCLDAQSLGFVNLGTSGSTPVEGFYLLNRLIERGAVIDQMIVSYGPFHIFAQDAFHSQTRYFSLIDQTYAEQILQQAEELGDAEYLSYEWQALEVLDQNLPVLSDDLKFRLVNVLSLDRTLMNIWPTLRSRFNWSSNSEAKVVDPRHKLYDAMPSDKINRRPESPEYAKPDGYSPINELYLKKLVSVANTNNIEIGYLIMPYNQDVLHPDAEFYDRFLAVLDSSGMTTCSIGGEWWPNELFADAHHLNTAGTKKFNLDLEARLRFCPR